MPRRATPAVLAARGAERLTDERLAARYGVLLTVSYDGQPFSGYARQLEARTIAGELDGAVRAVDAKGSLVRGASRTDAGVHARGNRVAFDSVLEIPSRGWVLALARELPREIAIVRASRVEPGYEPSRRALRKTYRYALYQSELRDPFLAGRAWRVPYRLNHSLMHEAAQSLLGEHDFAAFRAAKDPREDTVRQLFRVEVRKEDRDQRLSEIFVEGNKFMYHMVRIIVGALVDVGRGHLDPSVLKNALASKRRQDLGMTAPAEGLYLESMVMDSEGEEPWPALPEAAPAIDVG